jgi:hypothetical protein
VLRHKSVTLPKGVSFVPAISECSLRSLKETVGHEPSGQAAYYSGGTGREKSVMGSGTNKQV